MTSRSGLLGLVAITLALGAPRVQAHVPAAAQELALAKPRFIATWVRAGEPNDASGLSLLQRRVSLDLTGVPLASALRQVASQARLDLSYDKAVLPRKRVSIRAQGLTVVAALTEMLFQSGLDVAVGRTGQLGLVRKPEAAAIDSGSIAGRVTDRATHAPIAGATIVVDGTSQRATSGGDGTYRLVGVPTGTIPVRARYIGYAPGALAVTVNTDQETTVDFALEKSAQRLNEVVTTGTVVPTEVKALPSPVSIVSARDIELLRPQTTQELLRQLVPTAVSWDLAEFPFQTAFSVRGSSTLSAGAGQMKVFVDGVEAANPTTAPSDPKSIERIEVVRGPQAAAIYGSDAIGGVIQIFTKRGEQGLDRPRLDAEASVGVVNTPYEGFESVFRQSYSASVRGGGTDVSYNLGAGYSRRDDYIPNGEISDQSNPSVYGGMSFTRGMISLDLTARYYNQNNPQVFNPELFTSGFVPFSRPNYQPNRTQNQTLGAKLGFAPRSWWSNTLILGLDRTTNDLVQERPRLTTPSDTLLLLFNQSQAKASVGFNSSLFGTVGPNVTGSLTIGVDHWRRPSEQFFTTGAAVTTGTIRTDPTLPVVASRTVTTNTGYFAQAQVGLKDALFVTGGLRAEENSDFGPELGTPFSPRAGVSYARQLGNALIKLRGSYGRAIRPPGQGRKDAFVSAGNIILPNPELAPERQQGWDMGADAAFGSVASIGVTYYDQTADDLIQQVFIPGQSVPTSQYQNVGRVGNTGVEIEGTASVAGVELRAQYGYTRSRIEALPPNYSGDLTVGEQARLTPKHTGGASITFQFLRQTTITASAAYVGPWNTYDWLAYFRCLGATGACRNSDFGLGDYVIEYPDFAKLNLGVTQLFTPQLSGFVSVTNLANSHAHELWNITTVVGRTATVGARLQY